jgi:hypothetical protein
MNRNTFICFPIVKKLLLSYMCFIQFINYFVSFVIVTMLLINLINCSVIYAMPRGTMSLPLPHSFF